MVKKNKIFPRVCAFCAVSFLLVGCTDNVMLINEQHAQSSEISNSSADKSSVSSDEDVKIEYYDLSLKNKDSDKDHLSDFYEVYYFLTDPNVADDAMAISEGLDKDQKWFKDVQDRMHQDLDEDGLSVYDEMEWYDTNPNLPDTDGDGILDGEEDLDGDGLTRLEEVELGTLEIYEDSDFDLLSDFDEVRKYKTNPMEEDSDGDGFRDYFEVTQKTDPLTPNSSVEVDIKSDYSSLKHVHLKGMSVTETRYVDIYPDSSVLLNGVPGAVGQAAGFSLGSIDLDKSKLKVVWDLSNETIRSDAQFRIYGYDKNGQELIELDTVISGDGKVFETDLRKEFKSYMLVDKVKFELAH